MSALHHPVFQSLVLPAGSTLLWLALLTLSGAAGRTRAGLAPALGLLAGLALLPGFEWPPRTAAQQLPWLVVGTLFVALALQAVRSRPRVVPGRPPVAAASPVGGLALAAIAVGAAGLAVLAVVGGSLLLGQLAGMLASACGAAAAWVLLRPGTAVTRLALAPLVAAGIAVALALAGRVGAVPLLLLVPALVVPWALARAAWPARRPRLALLAAAALAALPVALALALALARPPAAAPTHGDRPGAPADDPYYTPRWR